MPLCRQRDCPARPGPLAYDQEYNANFVTFESCAYYPFSTAKALSYNLRRELVLCFDFNRAPGVAVVCQEIDERTHVIGEV